MDDGALTDYLWPILREMIKTVIENRQDLIIEGCYIPADWEKSFTGEYLEHIRACFLVMSEGYIRSHFDDIRGFANCIESRLDDSGLCREDLILDNRAVLERCRLHGCRYILLEDSYDIDPDRIFE